MTRYINLDVAGNATASFPADRQAQHQFWQSHDRLTVGAGAHAEWHVGSRKHVEVCLTRKHGIRVGNGNGDPSILTVVHRSVAFQQDQAVERTSHMAKMYRVYSIIERPKQDDYWLNIGVAFPHDDGDGFNVILQALPLHGNGKIVLRAYDPEKSAVDTGSPQNSVSQRAKGTK